MHPDPDSHLYIRARVAKGTRLLVTVETQTTDGQPLGEEQFIFNEGETALPAPPAPESPALPSSPRRFRLMRPRLSAPDWLLALAVGVYLLVRLVGLSSFPIYFFTDEAVQSVLAGDLVRDGFRAPDKEVLPTYFKNVYQYNLSVSVYVQVLPEMLLPRSIEVTRGTAALFTLIPALAAGLALRNVFRSRYPWMGVLVLSMTPAWLLHSRTAFETALAVSFYAGFLYLYLRYRQGRTWYLYPAILFAALAFYSYSPAQVVVTVTALLLFLTDLRYHWTHKRALAWGLGLALLLALPYLRFLINHPDEQLNHLRQLGSYWSAEIGLGEKLLRFLGEYLKGLNPVYWYFPNETDFTRHRFGEYGHLFWMLLPFAATGIFLAVRRIRKPEYRTLLIAALAAPSGAALVELGITRALFMVIPMALLAALALSELLGWLARRWQARARAICLAGLVLLVAANGLMITDALANGPLWFHEYGLIGMQYGARQVFGASEIYLQQNPGTRLIVTPAWANGTDILLRFFYKDSPPFELGNIDGYLSEHRDLDDQTVFVMIPEEYQRALDSGKFSDVRVDQVLPYPDGKVGFLFVRLRYVDAIDLILAREQAEQRLPEKATLQLDGQEVSLVFSRLDMGTIENAFDHSDSTVLRTLVANPLSIEMSFAEPRTLSGLSARVGGVASEVTVRLYPQGSSEVLVFSQSVAENPSPREVEVSFDQSYTVERLVLEVRSVYDGDTAHVHLWEIRFK